MPMNKEKYAGVWPVMLTPLDARGEIDWPSLERLVEWYIAAGVHGLFAACQSSEMFYLSDAETVRLVRFVVERAAGRVPVVASGHTASVFSQQVDQIAAVAATGVDSVILISNRLAMPSEPGEVLRENMARIVDTIEPGIDLGIYECPYPYKRLLDDETVRWCAASGRFTFIKDTCCDIARIRRRLALVEGSRLHIANANAQTLLPSLQAGGHGYSGVMANFHPNLYVWLYENWRTDPLRSERLQNYLSVAALAESLSYPICAKDFQVSIGNFTTTRCRAVESKNYDASHEPATIRQMMALCDDITRTLQLL